MASLNWNRGMLKQFIGGNVNKLLKFTYFVCFTFFLTACAGMKVIHPNDQPSGTKMLDKQGNVVGTFTCSIVASNGQRVSAIGKTRDEARNEALAKCRDKTIISSCLPRNTKCVSN